MLNFKLTHYRTEAYGQAVLFRIDTPELAARQYVLESPEWAGHQLLPVGSKIERAESPGGSVLVGSGSIYRIMPCTKDAAIAAIERGTHRPLKLIELPPGQMLPAAESRDFECCGGNPEDGHQLSCANYDEHDEDDERSDF